jgi:DHA1 family inner membrane transport protein
VICAIIGGMKARAKIPLPLIALAAGAFGIGVTEFVIMGLLVQVGASFDVSISTAGLLISGYALGVVVGAPVLTVLTGRWSHKRVLLGLMAVFVIGNIGCAIAPSYGLMMAARILTAFAHGTFFGVGSVVATQLVAPERRSSAIAIMFTGLTVANILGVPFGTWVGQLAGWRATFWVVAVVGVMAFLIIARLVPADRDGRPSSDLASDLRVITKPAVLLGLVTTTLGYAGVFAVVTYIAPLLTRISGFGEGAISPILLLFGAGLVLGNLAGGRLADKALMPSIFGTLALLLATLLVSGPLLTFKAGALFAVTALGFATFSTVAPLQTWVMRNAQGAGESLASSFNIGAFNLGNAIGAWAGGVALDRLGLVSLTWVAALFPLAALGVASFATLGQRTRTVTQPIC